MATFLIAGDSWGCGEWGSDPYEVKHTGLQHFLEQSGHEVKNISKGGNSNSGTFILLENSLQAEPVPDYIIWFQTDPLRDLRPYDNFKNIVTIEHMQAISKVRLYLTYKKLNNLGVKIYCIGGLSKLNIKLMKDYKNLIPMIPSVKELCVPDHCHSNIAFSDWIKFISKEFQDFDELISIKHEFDNFFENPSNKVFFWPDGVHPNRYGHKIIFDKLCDTLGLDKKLSN